MAYNVKIDVFEGPFDLLLHLVRQNEMDIYDIQIASITDQYLSYIKEMEKLDLKLAGEFLVMAATLINLKSRTLMPPLQPDQEPEEQEPEEEFGNIRNAQDLMRQLIEYRQFKEMAVNFSEREEEQLRIFYRNSVLPVVSDGGENTGLKEDISLLFSAFARVLEFAENRPTHRVLEEQFSVEEKIEEIRHLLDRTDGLMVGDLFLRCINKDEIVTLFLAMLEICRMKIARVRQRSNFGDIMLVTPERADSDDDDE